MVERRRRRKAEEAARRSPKGTREWYDRKRRRYARFLRRAGLSPKAISRRFARRFVRWLAATPETIATWVEDVTPRAEEGMFGLLAEYEQVRDLRDRTYRTLVGAGEDEDRLDPSVARMLLPSYDRMLNWSLTLSGKGSLFSLRTARKGLRELIERMVLQLGDILRDLGVLNESALIAHADEITRRMIAAAPGWFEVAEEGEGAHHRGAEDAEKEEFTTEAQRRGEEEGG